MLLHITKIPDRGTMVLHVDGELFGAGVRELERVTCGVHPLRIDLKNLLRADVDGLTALRRLGAAGAELANVPPYFSLLLERAAEGR